MRNENLATVLNAYIKQTVLGRKKQPPLRHRINKVENELFVMYRRRMLYLKEHMKKDCEIDVIDNSKIVTDVFSHRYGGSQPQTI